MKTAGNGIAKTNTTQNPPGQPPQAFWSLSSAQVLQRLQTSVNQGLTAAEVRQRLDRLLANRLQPRAHLGPFPLLPLTFPQE